MWQFLPFLPFLAALHSLQLVPAPCLAMQQGGMRRLCFLSCLCFLPSADLPGRHLIEFFYVKMDFFSLRRIIEPVSSQVENCPCVPEAEDEGHSCTAPGVGTRPGCPVLAPCPCGMAVAEPQACSQRRELRSWSGSSSARGSGTAALAPGRTRGRGTQEGAE